MHSYLAFLHSGIETYTGKAIEDGKRLAIDCIEQLKKLDNPNQFPPRLLILLASPSYLAKDEALQLVQGIHQTFQESFGGPDYEDVPLIGSSVAAVFFKHPALDNRVHERGALLMCLASRLIKAKVAVGPMARENPEAAVEALLKEFGLNPKEEVDPNPLADRTLLTFLPGFGAQGVTPGYPAPGILRLLRKGLKTRIRIAGGVSSAGDPNRGAPGLQFAGREVFEDAVVAARIITGIPIGSSLAHGLTPTGQVLRVKTLSQDRRTIEEFVEGFPAEVIRKAGEHVLLGRISLDLEPMTAIPRIDTDNRSAQLIREIGEQDYFEILRPDPENILKTALGCITWPRDRLLIQNPAASLILICNAWRLRYQKAGLDIERSLRLMEEQIPGAPCVGGFVDGEVGEDETGRSLFDNGSVTGIVFGDEMRERTPLHRGFRALAKYGPKLTRTAKPSDERPVAELIDEAIDAALQIVVEAGFPGAMLSLILRNREDQFIVGRKALGRRFEKIVDETRRSCSGDDILAVVYCEREPRPIEGEYLIPLMQLGRQVRAILQVDLGGVRKPKPTEEDVLDSFGDVISASLNRLFNWLEVDVGRKLDQALNESLSKKTVEEGLQHLIAKAVDVFGVKMGHARLANHETRQLILAAGIGDCYESAKEIRRSAGFEEVTPLCWAIKKDDVTVVNDTQSDYVYQQMCRNYASNPQLLAALKKMGSYMTVAFKNEAGVKLGALNLASTKEWFFTRSHMLALLSLGKQIGYLVEHFRRKESEEAAMKRVKFVLNASPRLAEVEDLDDMSGELEKAIKRFCEEARAQWGSLYIWDEDREYYILRAQYGWHKTEWVNAARYSRSDGWTGASAVKGLPIHIPDLYQHYLDNQYDQRYTAEAFGFTLSEEVTVEAIGVPLIVGANQLGVLTLYRRKEGQSIGFTTIDREELLEGASGIAGLASALLARRTERWEEAEKHRRKDVYHTLSQQEDRRTFAMRVCQEVLRSYRAIRADFYKVEKKVEKTRTEIKLIWIDGFSRAPGSEEIREEKYLPPDLPELVKKTSSDKDVRVQRRELTKDERGNPRLAATEGLVERACIPLVSGKELIGILDLRWRVGAEQASTIDALHSKDYLFGLGEDIASVYRRHQIKMEAERSQRAAEAAGAYSFQQAHRLGNVVQRIYRLAQSIKENKDEKGREEKIGKLLKTTETAREMTGSILELGESVVYQVCAGYPLYRLVNKALKGIDSDKLKHIRSGKIELAMDISKDIIVYVDPKLTREAFVNLINNAIQAILNKDKTEKDKTEPQNATSGNGITITAAVTEDRRDITIVFEDTGVGMSKSRKENALRGFFSTKGHRGVGVLISTVLLTAQGGLLAYESEEGAGTRAIVTLPLAYQGEKPKVVATLSLLRQGE